MELFSSGDEEQSIVLNMPFTVSFNHDHTNTI